jgi:bacillithiol biosynthesis cysteine-adding enzyme BshC
VKPSIPLDKLPAGNVLSLAYLQASADVQAWYHHDVQQNDWAGRRIEELQLRGFPERGLLAESITGRMSAWGADQQSLAAARSLAESETFVVTTGQQVGLFGGPLYSALKAMTVILHARRLAAQFPNLRFVPLFGMASIDSDFDEVRSCSLLDRGLQPQQLSLEHRSPDDNRIISARDVSSELPGLLDQLLELLPAGVHAEGTIAALRDSYCDGSLVNGFARWMLKVFAGTGLVLVDTSDPLYLRSSADLLLRQLELALEASKLISERNRQITTAGYPLQVDSPEGDLQLFWLDDTQQRRKLQFADGRIELRDGSQEISHAEILKQAESAPQRFVPGALLGPLWQDRMLPNVAWVGGQAELAYRAQSSALFEFHGLRMAPSFMRCTATLLPGRQAQQLDEFGWELTDLYRPQAELENLAVAALKPDLLDATVANYMSHLENADAELLKIACTVDPGLEQSFATIRGNILSTAGKLEKKVTSALKRHNEILTRRSSALHSLAYPGNVLQERVIGYASFLARYGFELSDRLLNQLDPLQVEHRVIIID